MSAWTHMMEPGPVLLFLVVISASYLVQAAPFDNDQSTEIEYYPVADATGCYYNFEHYDEGDRIITNEPCLNCTCHNRMLMCYLRVCPFTKAIGQNCKVEKKSDQCCPVITCPEVPVQLVPQSSTEPSTALGHINEYGCSIDNLFYADGAKVPSNPDNPCEVCYCIRNKTACIIQECTLTGKVVEGCQPVYLEGVCCPLRYDCDHPQIETTPRPLLTTTTTTTTTTTLAPTTSSPRDCKFGNEFYADGALVKEDLPCEKCYCMRGDIVCAVQECGPTPLDKVNCTALPIKQGQCCPDTYDCADISDEDLTTLSYYEAPTTLPTPISSESEGEAVEDTETAAPHEVSTEREELATEENIVEGGRPTTESFTEVITSRITEAVTDIVESITSTIYGSTEKSVEGPEQHEKETSMPEVITESVKESETEPPLAQHTETDAVVPIKSEEQTTTEKSDEEDETIVHDDHEEPEDNEIDRTNDKPETTTLDSRVPDRISEKPDDNVIEKHDQTTEVLETISPDQEVDTEQAPEHDVITKASVEGTHTSIEGSKPTEIPETLAPEQEKTEIPTEKSVEHTQQPEVIPDIVIPTTEQVGTVEDESEPTEIQRTVPHTSAPEQEETDVPTEKPVEHTQQPEVIPDIVIPTTEEVETVKEEGPSGETEVTVGEEKVTVMAGESSTEEVETPIKITEIPELAAVEHDINKPPEITQETVQPSQGHEEITQMTITEIPVSSDIGRQPEEEVPSIVSSEPTERFEETQTVQNGEDEIIIPTTEAAKIPEDEMHSTVTEGKPMQGEGGKITDVPVEGDDQSPVNEEVTERVPTEKPEEIEIVTGIPTKETERPQSMDHVSEITSGAEIPEIQKQDEPSESVTQQPLENPIKETEVGGQPEIVEKCTKEGCAQPEHVPASNDVPEKCTKEGCTVEGLLPDESIKGQETEEENIESDLPKGAVHDCIDGEDCVPEEEHEIEFPEPSEDKKHDSEQETSAPEITSTPSSIVQSTDTTKEEPVFEHDSTVPGDEQVTDTPNEQSTKAVEKDSDGEQESSQTSTPEVSTEHKLAVTETIPQETESSVPPVEPEHIDESTTIGNAEKTTAESIKTELAPKQTTPGGTEEPGSTVQPESTPIESEEPESSEEPEITQNVTQHPDIESDEVTTEKVKSSGESSTTEHPDYAPAHEVEGSGEPESTKFPEIIPVDVPNDGSGDYNISDIPDEKVEYVTPTEGIQESETTKHPEEIPEHVTSLEKETSSKPESTEFPSKPEHSTHTGGSDQPESTDKSLVSEPEQVTTSEVSIEPETAKYPVGIPEHATSQKLDGSGEPELTDSPITSPEVSSSEGIVGTETTDAHPEHFNPTDLPESDTDLSVRSTTESLPEHPESSEDHEGGNHTLPESGTEVPERGVELPEIGTVLPETETEPQKVGSTSVPYTESPETKPERVTDQEVESSGELTESPESRPENETVSEGSGESGTNEHPDKRPESVTPEEVESSGEPFSPDLPESRPEYVTTGELEGSGEIDITEHPEYYPPVEPGTTEDHGIDSKHPEMPPVATEIPEGSSSIHPLEERTTIRLPSESSTEQQIHETKTPDGITKIDRVETTITPIGQHEVDQKPVGTEPSVARTPEVAVTETKTTEVPSMPVSHSSEITEAPENIHPSTSTPESEVSTTAEKERVIPGEGNCLVDGQTYSNNSQVPPINQCHISCKCVSSILQCESIACTGPPSDMLECMPIFQSPGSCCPTYTCSGKDVANTMESDSHVVETTIAGVEEESPVTHVPSVASTSQEDATIPEKDVPEIIPSVEEKRPTTQSTITHEETEKIPGEDETVITLTTGSPVPSKDTEHEVEIPVHVESEKEIPGEPIEETHITPEHCEGEGCKLPMESSISTTTYPTVEENQKEGTQPTKENPEVSEKHCGAEGCTPVEEPQVIPEYCGSEGCEHQVPVESDVDTQKHEEHSTISTESPEKDHCGPEGCVPSQETDKLTTTSPSEVTTQHPIKESPEPAKHCGPEGCLEVSPDHCGPEGCASIDPQQPDTTASTTTSTTEGELEETTEEPSEQSSVEEIATTEHSGSDEEYDSMTSMSSNPSEQDGTTVKITTDQKGTQSTEMTTDESVPEITEADQYPAVTTERKPIGEPQSESSTLTITENQPHPEEDKTEASDEVSAGEQEVTKQETMTQTPVSHELTTPEVITSDLAEVITETLPKAGASSTESITEGEAIETTIQPVDIEEHQTVSPQTSSELTEPPLEGSPAEPSEAVDKQSTEIFGITTAAVAEVITESAKITGEAIESADHVTEPAKQEPSIATESSQNITSQPEVEPAVSSKEQPKMETTIPDETSKVTEEKVTEPEIPEPNLIFDITTAAPAEVITESAKITGEAIESADHVTEPAKQEQSIATESSENITSQPGVEPTVSSKEQPKIETTIPDETSKVTEEKVTEPEIPEPNFPTHPSEVSSPASIDVFVVSETTTARREVTEPEAYAEGEKLTTQHPTVNENTETQTEQEMAPTTEAKIPEVGNYSTEAHLDSHQSSTEEQTPEKTEHITTESQPEAHEGITSPSSEESSTDLPDMKEGQINEGTESEGVPTGEVPLVEVTTHAQIVGDEVTEAEPVIVGSQTGTEEAQHTSIPSESGEFTTKHLQQEQTTELPEVATVTSSGEVVTKSVPQTGEVVTGTPEEQIANQPIEGSKTHVMPESEHEHSVNETHAEDITTEAQKVPGIDTTEVHPGTQGVTERHPDIETDITTEAQISGILTSEVHPASQAVTEKLPEVEIDITTEAQQVPGEETTRVHPAGQGVTEKLPEIEISTQSSISTESTSESLPIVPESETEHSPKDHIEVEVTEAQPGEVGISSEKRPTADEEVAVTTEGHLDESETSPSDGERSTESHSSAITSEPAIKDEIETTGPPKEVYTSPTQAPRNDTELYTSGPAEAVPPKKTVDGELSTSSPLTSTALPEPVTTESSHEIFGEHDEHIPELPDYQSPTEDYDDGSPLGPGTCRYGGKVFVSAQQIPRDDPCDFCFCFRSDIICLQQSCPPPIPNCHEEPIRGFCCPRYECPVGMATALNMTTTTTTTTTTLPPHFFAHAYKGRARKTGCLIQGRAYRVGDYIKSASGPCMHCTCGGDGQMKCDPKQCSPEPMLRQMIAAASRRRR